MIAMMTYKVIRHEVDDETGERSVCVEWGLTHTQAVEFCERNSDDYYVYTYEQESVHIESPEYDAIMPEL